MGLSIAVFLLVINTSLLGCFAQDSTVFTHVVDEATTEKQWLSGYNVSGEELISQAWEWQLKNFPEFATEAGVHSYDDKLNTVSLQNYERLKNEAEQYMERAAGLLINEKNISTATDLKLLVDHFQTYVSGMQYKGYFFPISNLDGPQANFERIYEKMDLSNATGYLQLIERYKAFPKQADGIIEVMKEGIRQNMTMHNFSMSGTKKAFDRLQTTAEESPFYEPFLNMSGNISERERVNIQDMAKAVIEDYLKPAFKKLGDFIENEYKQSLRPEIAITSLPNGVDYYKQCILFHTDSQLSPQEIHDIGLEEVERIAKQMDEVILSLNLTMSRLEFIEQMRNDPKFSYESEIEVLDTFRNAVFNIIRPKLTDIVGFIPQLELQVVPMPPALEGGVIAMYMSGSLKDNNPGYFYIDNSNPKALKKYDVITLSLHEAEPGHHFQYSSLQEYDVPAFRKFLYYSQYSEMPSSFPIHTAYIEGWALYSEFLGFELGLYEDPYIRFGHLSYSMFRACRLVVDTGMHALGWSRQKAIDFMLKYLAHTSEVVAIEVDRYITWPGQALAYKVGEFKIKELRAQASTSLGAKFDVRDFHDVVLKSQGSMSFLEEQVNKYIQSTLNQTSEVES